MKFVYLLILCSWLSACASKTPTGEKPIPERHDRSTGNQLIKSDFDRMADVEISGNMQSLRNLMLKLYKRNPHELAKSTSDNAEKMTAWVFDGENQHHHLFKALNNKQDTAAIFQAFDAKFQGDRVLSYIVGLQTMLLKAHSNKTDFYLTDSLDPQKIYNVARNLEIAAWKLSNARDSGGKLYLLSNEMNPQGQNLSFEREFGKMIGSLDLFSITLAEKSQRTISRVVQNIATALFLPF